MHTLAIMNRPACAFCNPPKERVLIESQTVLAFLDAYPITEGHALVIPKRHVTSLFDLPEPEYRALWVQVAEVRKKLAKQFNAAAFNIGVNDGVDAGQTVGHAHIHVIPRYAGDVPDPRGGIRWIIPGKAKYW